MAQAPNQGIQITSKALMYEQPEPLHYDTHGDLGVKIAEAGFGFAKDQHFVPVTANEFGAAATTYPIILSGDSRLPLAVMGLRSGENLFVSEEGRFRDEAYVPAYIRRYPFVLAAPEDKQRMIVCVDRAFKNITDKPDLPFFKGENEPSDYTQNAIEFLKQYESQRLATDQMMARLNELDLFETKEVIYRPQMRGRPGEPQKITEYTGISEAKLGQLDEKTLKELAANGFLGAIYAHLISLFNWDRLIDASLRRQAESQGAPAADMPTEAPEAAPKTKGKGKSVKA